MWFNPPKRQDPYPDRQIDCQEALEPGFQILVEEMMAVGWSCDEIRQAFVGLMSAHDLAQESNAALEVELAFMRAQMRLPK
ncbi:hypothetical protein [Rhizobiales bacterium 3FA27D7]|jgi:hypothetical protein|uniref:hypothetical protein n=1 Tax=Mesorhizobium sp. 2RAF21 TaxID=3232995 RepID=UPI0010F7A660